MEISFVDENDFLKEGRWYFLRDDSQWDTMRTSEATDVHFRLKLKITRVESTYSSQRPDSPSLSPYFLLLEANCKFKPIKGQKIDRMTVKDSPVKFERMFW